MANEITTTSHNDITNPTLAVPYIQRALSNLVMIGRRRHGEPAAILPYLSPVGPAAENAP